MYAKERKGKVRFESMHCGRSLLGSAVLHICCTTGWAETELTDCLVECIFYMHAITFFRVVVSATV